MEDLKTYIVTNWPTIIENAAMVVAYFLVFLYRSKVNMTKRDLSVLFKEKATEVAKTDANLRIELAKTSNLMHRELVEAKAQYQKAVGEIRDLRERLARVEGAVEELITEEVVDDGEGKADANDEES